MYHETSDVDGAVVAADAIAILVDVDHVRYGKHAEVGGVGVDPEGVGIYRV